MDGKTEVQIAEEAWCGNLRRNRSRIVDIFQFQVVGEESVRSSSSTVICKPRETETDFLDLCSVLCRTLSHHDVPCTGPVLCSLRCNTPLCRTVSY